MRMKNHIKFMVILLITVSCKNKTDQSSVIPSETSVQKDLVTMRGDFIYHDGAAVLQTPNAIYGVVIDDQLESLRKQVEPYKSSDLEMVTVTVKAIRIPKPASEEGWPFRVEIKEVLKIEQPESKTREIIELSK
jgi:hypothetical protein